jgi:cell division septum initiation protein DivIVA
MTTTPVEIRHLRPGRALLGYSRVEVDEALEEIARSFEEVWRERGELGDKVDALEAEVTRLRETEELLRNTLVAAERAAADTRERACREADRIVAEAHAEARAATRAGQADRDRLLAEAGRIRALLEAALGLARDAEESVAESPPAEPANEPKDGAEEYPAGWPRLEDTADVTPLTREDARRRRTA